MFVNPSFVCVCWKKEDTLWEGPKPLAYNTRNTVEAFLGGRCHLFTAVTHLGLTRVSPSFKTFGKYPSFLKSSNWECWTYLYSPLNSHLFGASFSTFSHFAFSSPNPYSLSQLLILICDLDINWSIFCQYQTQCLAHIMHAKIYTSIFLLLLL